MKKSTQYSVIGTAACLVTRSAGPEYASSFGSRSSIGDDHQVNNNVPTKYQVPNTKYRPPAVAA